MGEPLQPTYYSILFFSTNRNQISYYLSKFNIIVNQGLKEISNDLGWIRVIRIHQCLYKLKGKAMVAPRAETTFWLFNET